MWYGADEILAMANPLLATRMAHLSQRYMGSSVFSRAEYCAGECGWLRQV